MGQRKDKKGKASVVDLGIAYELTTDNPASSYGIPVFVKLKTKEVFGPGDMVAGDVTAAQAVRALTQMIAVTPKEQVLVDKFLKAGKVSGTGHLLSK